MRWKRHSTDPRNCVGKYVIRSMNYLVHYKVIPVGNKPANDDIELIPFIPVGGRRNVR